MPIRRWTSAVVAMAGALTGVSIAASAWAGGASPPLLHVTVGPVQCHDLSFLTEAVPGAKDILASDGTDTKHVATVGLTFQSTANDGRSVPYVVTIDGQRKASGSVSGGGRTINSFTIPNGTTARLVVTSDRTVIADQPITARC